MSRLSLEDKIQIVRLCEQTDEYGERMSFSAVENIFNAESSSSNRPQVHRNTVQNLYNKFLVSYNFIFEFIFCCISI